MKQSRIALLGLAGLLFVGGAARAQDTDGDRLKKLEEQVQALLKEQQRLKDAQAADKKTISDLQNALNAKQPGGAGTTQPNAGPNGPNPNATGPQVVRPDRQTAPPPGNKPPVIIGGDITFRYDNTTTRSLQTGLIPVGDQGSFRERVRLNFGAPLSDRSEGGFQITTGLNPSPGVPFVTLGDAFRSKSFNLGRAFLNYYFGDKAKFNTPSLTIGKMDNPIWRAEIGNWDDEIEWDHDVAPEGIALRLPLTKNNSTIGLVFTPAFFTINIPQRQRFAGLTTDTYAFVNQLKVDAGVFRGAINYTVYDNLNSGLLVPTYIPGFGIDTSTAQNAFLLRNNGVQATNNHYTYGNAFGFAGNTFDILHLTGQLLPHIKGTKLQPFITADYLRNFSARVGNEGYGLTIGATNGGAARGAYTAWFTYREVSADATLGTFADSDLGAGTDYRGYQLGFAYRFLSNTLLRIAYHSFDGAPTKTTGTDRLFVDVSRSF